MLALDLILENQTTFTLCCALFGLMIGSFLNVVIYRLPIMLERAWHLESSELLGQNPKPEHVGTFNLNSPRSRCSNCETPISAWQNIPIISFLLLRGKCASCQHAISWRYPFVELTTALLTAVVAWHFFPDVYTAIAAIVLTWTLIALTGIDYDTYLLPDNITLPLVWLGLIVNYFGLITTLDSALWGAVAGYGSLWSIFWLFKLLTGKEGMGYGDFKLLAALGAWLGWQMLPAIVLISSLVAAVIGISLIVFSGRERSKAIPFGPYLAIAGWIVLLWGAEINGAYLSYAGLV